MLSYKTKPSLVVVFGQNKPHIDWMKTDWKVAQTCLSLVRGLKEPRIPTPIILHWLMEHCEDLAAGMNKLLMGLVSGLNQQCGFGVKDHFIFGVSTQTPILRVMTRTQWAVDQSGEDKVREVDSQSQPKFIICAIDCNIRHGNVQFFRHAKHGPVLSPCLIYMSSWQVVHHKSAAS
jgi:hypothetical protein